MLCFLQFVIKPLEEQLIFGVSLADGATESDHSLEKVHDLNREVN